MNGAVGQAPLPFARWLMPMLFFQGYLALTVWMFFYGPWPWSVDHPVQLAIFLGLAQLAMAVGYLFARRRVCEHPLDTLHREKQIGAGIRLLKAAVLVSAVMALPSSLSRTGSALPQVLEGVRNTGIAYNENFERLDSGNAYVVVEYGRMLLSPWLTAVFPLLVLYWTRLRWSWRLAALGVVTFNLSMYLATGTNKGIADMVITLPWLVLLAVFSGLLRIRRAGLKAGLTGLAMLLLFLLFFGAGQLQREGSGGEYGTFFTGETVLQADSDHFISRLLPTEYRVIFEALSRYVVHGYYALSLALGADSPSTLGFGHSMFLARNADALFGTGQFVRDSLPGVLERDYGWGTFLLWHSIYPWLASDVGFAGTFLVIGALSYLLGLAWGRAIVSCSAPWTVMLYLMLVLFYYVPANNQIFQSGETFFAFFLLLWMIARQRGPRRGRSDRRPDSSPALIRP